MLRRYLDPYLAVARRHGVGFVVEAPTWRANPAWGSKPGYSLDSLAELVRSCVGFFTAIREREDTPERPIVLSAEFGPEGDGYEPKRRMTADEAEEFHRWQVNVVADTEVDMVSGLTLTYAEEAVGLVRAAASAGLPAAVSFTVEADGRLPSGQSLAEAIDEVDAETGAAAVYFMVNCAHPTHFQDVLSRPGPWERVRGVRANASKRTHAELDESHELDAGHPAELAQRYLEIRRRLPNLTVLGGCCGTDHRHIESIADAWFAGPAR